MNDNEKEKADLVNEIHAFAADLMFQQKKSTSETKKILIEQGLVAEDADIVIWHLQQIVANYNISLGIILGIAGLVITIITFFVTDQPYSTYIYIIALIIVIYGIIRFFKGFSLKLSKPSY